MQNNQAKILFQSGPLSVSTTMLRFRGRRYKLNHIENLILKRPLFLMGLGLGFMLAGFAVINTDLLYFHELFIIGVIAILAPAAAWPFGTLTMHSRTLSTSEGSITWFYSDLAKAQTAIENAIVPNDSAALSYKE